MSLFKDWDVHKIILDDTNYYNDCEKFFNELWDDYSNFIEKSELSKNKKKEISKIKSPFTVLDGKWGSGKTFFIEKFIENFNKIQENNKEKFEECIYIDALDILDDENLIYSLIYELLKKSKKIKNASINQIKKITGFGFNVLVGFINGSPLPAEMKKKDTNHSIDEKKYIENAESTSFEKKTIVFIDNIERLGYDAKKIISLIYKLRKIDNLVFVAIANVKMINDMYVNEYDGHEYPIYKFINFNSYIFMQNYKSIIKNLNENKIDISDDELETINNSLNNTTKNNQLSIREFERWVVSHNFFEVGNKIKRLLLINKIDGINIKPFFEKQYSNEIKAYIKNLREINKIFDELNEKINQWIYVKDENYILDKNGYKRDERGAFFDSNSNEYRKNNYSYDDESLSARWRKIINNSYQGNSLILNEVKELAIKHNTLFFYGDEILETFAPNNFKDYFNFLNTMFKNDFRPFELNLYLDKIINFEKYFDLVLTEMKNETVKLNEEINRNISKSEELNKEHQNLEIIKEKTNLYRKALKEKERLQIKLDTIEKTNWEEKERLKRTIKLVDDDIKEIINKKLFDNEIESKITDNENKFIEIQNIISELEISLSSRNELLNRWEKDSNEIKNLIKSFINSIHRIKENIDETFQVVENNNIFTSKLLNSEGIQEEIIQKILSS